MSLSTSNESNEPVPVLSVPNRMFVTFFVHQWCTLGREDCVGHRFEHAAARRPCLRKAFKVPVLRPTVRRVELLNDVRCNEAHTAIDSGAMTVEDGSGGRS